MIWLPVWICFHKVEGNTRKLMKTVIYDGTVITPTNQELEEQQTTDS